MLDIVSLSVGSCRWSSSNGNNYKVSVKKAKHGDKFKLENSTEKRTFFECIVPCWKNTVIWAISVTTVSFVFRICILHLHVVQIGMLIVKSLESKFNSTESHSTAAMVNLSTRPRGTKLENDWLTAFNKLNLAEWSIHTGWQVFATLPPVSGYWSIRVFCDFCVKKTRHRDQVWSSTFPAN